MMKYIFLIVFMLTSCYSDQEKQNCMDKIRNESAMNPLSRYIISSLKDSINQWKSDSVLRFSYYDTRDKWYFDELVLFTSDSNRAYSWVYKIPNDTNKILYNIELYVAEKKNGIWIFYLAGMPVYGFSKSNNNNTAYTKESLRREFDRNFYKHIDFSSCEIIESDNLVNNFFSSKWNIYGCEQDFWEKHYKEKSEKAQDQIKISPNTDN